MGDESTRTALPEPHWFVLLGWSTAFPLVLSLVTKWGSSATVVVSVAATLLLLLTSLLPAARRKRKSLAAWGATFLATIVATAVGVWVLIPAVAPPKRPALVGDASKDAILDGAAGVANITRGETKYKAYADLVKDQDHLAIELYTRDWSMTAGVTPRFRWSCKEMEGGGLLFSVVASARHFVGWERSVVISADPGERVRLESVPNNPITLRSTDLQGNVVTIEVGQMSDKDVCRGSAHGATLRGAPPRDAMTLKLVVAANVQRR